MIDHPLTNRVAEKIAHTAHWSSDVEDVVFTHDDMRAATDWQLEQVIEWLNAVIFEQSTRFGIESLPKELEKAMRPQQQENNQ